jgi:hypothetical protein
MQVRWPGGVVAGLVVLAAACGGGKGSRTTTMSSGSAPRSLRVPTVDPSLCDTGDKKVVTADLDHDGEADVWKLYASSIQDGTKVEVLTCKQVDFDHDGRKDYVATYALTGDKVAEEFDFGFDGKFDAREHFDKKAGTPTVVERDTDHDKQPDMWERYKDGVLEAVHRDRNGDARPDMWETYDAGGQLSAILFDDDYDGRVDRKETARRAPGQVPGLPATTGSKGPADESAAEAAKLPDATTTPAIIPAPGAPASTVPAKPDAAAKKPAKPKAK